MRRRFVAGVIGACAAVVLAGCASPRLVGEVDGSLPRRHELTGTPFFPQVTHHCGPASLATVLVAAGFDATPEALAPQVYLPARQGSLPLDMLGGARRAGALAATISPDLDTLLATVRDGQPVVVLQNLGLWWYPVWHYAVVIGHDLDRRELLLRSGLERREAISLRTFDLTWARGGRWAMVTLQPGAAPPIGIPRDRYAEAALALERIGRTNAAARAYVAGLTRWPADLQFAIGAGNASYALGDLAAAEAVLRTATAAHPASDVALNNLAHVLMERGALDEAESVAARAIALGGPQRATAASTLDEIRARRATAGR